MGKDIRSHRLVHRIPSYFDSPDPTYLIPPPGTSQASTPPTIAVLVQRDSKAVTRALCKGSLPCSNCAFLISRGHDNIQPRKKEGHCDITARTVLLYVLLCLTYMYCTLYVLYILHTVHIVHVSLFPSFPCLSDVEASSSTSVHACFCSHFIKHSQVHIHLA